MSILSKNLSNKLFITFDCTETGHQPNHFVLESFLLAGELSVWLFLGNEIQFCRISCVFFIKNHDQDKFILSKYLSVFHPMMMIAQNTVVPRFWMASDNFECFSFKTIHHHHQLYVLERHIFI